MCARWPREARTFRAGTIEGGRAMRTKWLFQALALGITLGVGAALPGAFASADPPQPPHVAQFDEISVHRLNIVEPNGRYRLVLANAERFPGLFMNGQEYRHHNRN